MNRQPEQVDLGPGAIVLILLALAYVVLRWLGGQVDKSK